MLTAKECSPAATTSEPRMPIRVYNTLSKNKEPFEPVKPGQVGIYLCGPTVYKPSHIGHMVGPVIFDAIKRYLAYSRLQGDAGRQHHRRRRQADQRIEQPQACRWPRWPRR